MAILSRRKPPGSRRHVEILLKETAKMNRLNSEAVDSVLKVRLKITIFVNPNEFWSIKTRIRDEDRLIYSGIIPFV